MTRHVSISADADGGDGGGADTMEDLLARSADLVNRLQSRGKVPGRSVSPPGPGGADRVRLPFPDVPLPDDTYIEPDFKHDLQAAEVSAARPAAAPTVPLTVQTSRYVDAERQWEVRYQRELQVIEKQDATLRQKHAEQQETLKRQRVAKAAGRPAKASGTMHSLLVLHEQLSAQGKHGEAQKILNMAQEMEAKDEAAAREQQDAEFQVKWAELLKKQEAELKEQRQRAEKRKAVLLMDRQRYTTRSDRLARASNAPLCLWAGVGF